MTDFVPDTSSRESEFRIAPLSDLEITDEVRGRLSQSLNSIVTGSTEVLRSPFLSDYSVEDALELIDAEFMSEVENLPQVVKDMELSNRDKFQPRSIQDPWSVRQATLKEYFNSDSAKGNIVQTKEPGRLRHISPAKAILKLKNSTAAGLPDMVKKGVAKEGLLSTFEEQLDKNYPGLLFTRTQPGKTRNVIGPGIADALYEMMIFSPLLEWHKSNSPWRSALIGPSQISERVTHLLRLPGKKVSVDFSAYDSTLRETSQTYVRDYIKNKFQIAEHDMIDAIMARLLTIGVVTPDGIYYGNHGVPSGSTLTNEVDSDAQFIISSSVLDTMNEGDINGDDGIYSTDEVDSLIRAFTDEGLVVNDEKTHVSDEYFIYLQNYYGPEYIVDGLNVPVYPLYRTLANATFMERWVNFEEFGLIGADYFNIALISKLENNVNHPLYRKLVQFCLKHDKYDLKVSEKGLSKYVEMITQTSGTQDIFQNQYSDDIKGFKNFTTVKLIKELSS
jgi:hypothetical protein